MPRNVLFSRSRRRLLMAGVSVIALLAVTGPARAGAALDALGARGGTSTAASAQAAATAAAQASAAVSQQSRANVTRALDALKSAQTAQAAARAAAQAAVSSVTNGLGEGGLNPSGGAVISVDGASVDLSRADSSKWQGVDSIKQALAAGQTEVTVAQSQSKAILTWESFNIGKETTLTFDQQGNSSWVALNRVENSIAPSQILGNLKADGQVYVINQNGIIFGGASQVNVHALIASTANITNDQFLNNGIYSTSTSTPSFTGTGDGTGSYAGLVRVEAGAEIVTAAPESGTEGGGFVMLLGRTVENEGIISTPNGQVLLAAGNNFLVREGYSTDSNAYSTTRGNEVAICDDAACSTTRTGGSVTNTGLIFAQQGDITLAGHIVTQNGVLIATTSVDTRGTIHLLNAISDTGGSIVLGDGSLTQILPETDSTDTAYDSKRDSLIADSETQDIARAAAVFGNFDNLSTLADREDQGRIEIVTGGLVDFQSGSLTMAQGGQIAVQAGTRIFTADGALLDVSGTSTTLAMSANQIEVNIQSNELRDSSINRESGTLLNEDVWIDVRDLVLVPASEDYDSDRYYTAGGLLEVSGYLNTTGHTIGEWTALGGTITLSAPEVVAQEGSVFNISGGALTYEGGTVTLTNLLGSDGKIYTVNDAPTDILFVGTGDEILVSHDRWGVTETYRRPFGLGATTTYYDSGYTIGRDAGTLVLSAATSIFEGTLVADAYNGERQTEERADGVTDGYAYTQYTVAQAGTLALGVYSALGRTGASTASVTIGDIDAITAGMSATDAIDSARTGTAWFDAASLNEAGLGGLSLASTKSIDVTSGLAMANGGTVELVAPTIDLAATITARGGSVTLTNVLTKASVSGGAITSGTATLSPDSGRASITLESGSAIDTRGLWTNLLLDSEGDASGLAWIDGGNVVIRSTGDVVFSAGATINASSGAAILADGSIQGGSGGDITLAASYNLNAPETGNHGDLTFDGTVISNGVTTGGALTLQTGGAIVIGGDAYSQGDTLPAGTVAAYDLVLTESVTFAAGETLPIDTTVTAYKVEAGAVMTQAMMISLRYGGFKVATNAANGGDYAVTQAEWTNIPVYMYYRMVGSTSTIVAQAGGTVPAGAEITQIGNIAGGITIPANIFPDGVSSGSVATPVIYNAGSVAPVAVTYAAGTVIPKGSVSVLNMAVRPIQVSSLSADLFQSGFSSYTVNAQSGLTVAAGTDLVVSMPVYQVSSDAINVATGADPTAALGLWTPALYQEDPTSSTLTQREGADLTLLSESSFVVLEEGASITVDPGHSVELSGSSLVDVEGSITAHGGNITISQPWQTFVYGVDEIASGTDDSRLWIGDTAVLDVSAQAYTATDALGRSYGVVPDGGSILIGRSAGGDYDAIGIAQAADAFIVIRPGAVLDASGTSGILSVTQGNSAHDILVASDGGSITLASYLGIVAEGTLRAAAGGTGAAGGTLDLILETPYYIYQNSSFSAEKSVQVGRVLTIGQSDVPGALGEDAVAETARLTAGEASISADQIEAGGFDTVSLGARDAILFDGDVSLSVGGSLTLSGAAIYDTQESGSVVLSAAYVLLDGKNVPVVPSYRTQPTTLSSDVTGGVGNLFSVTADTLDVRNALTTHFADTELTSSGDLRFLAGELPSATSATTVNPTTFIAEDGNLTLTAQQVYPATGAVVSVYAGYDATAKTYLPDATLTIASVDGTIPDLPYSVFGTISLLAPTVYQGGIVRAPLGSITLGTNPSLTTDPDTLTELLAGSITSVSAEGLTILYGGTADDVTYTVNGGSPITVNLASGEYTVGGSTYTQGIALKGTSVIGKEGATLDLSGGGTLTGAAFVTGSSGSVDVLTTPLVNANPAYSYSSSGNAVYAILPGVSVTPTADGYYESWTGDTPAVGRTITIPEGVSGLPAGTYTLLPASYALLPGAYRVELGSTGSGQTLLSGATRLTNGSYLVAGYQGMANTDILDVLPSTVIITPGETVRTYSGYKETGYAAFQTNYAATFGTLRPVLEADGKFLIITLGAALDSDGGEDEEGETGSSAALQFSGTADFSADEGGYGGSLVLMTAANRHASGTSSKTPNDLYITADGSSVARSSTVTTVSAADIAAFAAPNLYLGGKPTVNSASGETYIALSYNSSYNSVVLESGAVLQGARVFLSGSTVTVGDGAVIDTRGWGEQAVDSAATGYAYRNANSSIALLVVSNGQIGLNASIAGGSITIGDGAGLYTDGTIGFIGKTNPTFSGTVDFVADTLGLAAASINIGSDAALAAVTLPAGLAFDDNWLQSLLTNVDNLTLTASNSINFYGSIDLDFGSASTLVLVTPAIYGAGEASDAATIRAGTLVWNNSVVKTGSSADGSPIYASATPGALGSAGSGMGSLIVDAARIVLGYPEGSQPETTTTLDRLALGFSTVTLNASESISANNKGTLAVYQSGTDPSAGYDAASYSGSGGTLNLVTPLLTGEAGSILDIYAGGDVNVILPVGVTASTATPSALGADIGITSGGAVTIDTAIWLPSGALGVTATNDITLGASSRLQLAGQTIAMEDVTQYSWGGDVSLESTEGDITQAEGSVIDVSATGNDAGTLTLTATGASAGRVGLGGTLLGSGGEGHVGGSFDIRAQTIGDPASLSADFAALNTVLDETGFTESRRFDLKQGSLAIAAGQTVKAHDISISIDGGSLTVDGTVDASGESVGSIALAARDDLTVNGTLDAHGTVLDVDSDGVAIAANNSATIDLTTASGTLMLGNGAVLDLSTPDGVAYGEVTLEAPRTAETSGDVAVAASGALDIRGAKSIVLDAYQTYDLADGSVITQSTLDGYDSANQGFMAAAYSGDALNANLQTKLAGLIAYGDAFHFRPAVQIVSGGDLSTDGDIDLAVYRYGPEANRDTSSATYGAGEPMDLIVRAAGDLTINGSISDGYLGADGVPAVYIGLIEDISSSSAFASDTWDGYRYTYYTGNGSLYVTEDWIIPTNGFYNANGGLYSYNYTNYYTPGDTIPAGTRLAVGYVYLDLDASLPVLATTLVSAGTPAVSATSNAAIAIAAGLTSSIRLVSGADLSAAVTRTLTAASARAGTGNLLLSDAHTVTSSSGSVLTAVSTLRTGSGDLELLAGGDFSEDSLYNVSTNGSGDDTADLTVEVQGDLTGYIYASGNSASVSNWLGVSTSIGASNDSFSGLGTLGGGRVTIRVGGDAGETGAVTVSGGTTTTTTGLVVAATSGDVDIDIGGRLNPGGGNYSTVNHVSVDSNGTFTALRGDLTIDAGAIGAIPLVYGVNEVNDPRGTDPDTAAMTGNSSSVGPQGAITVVAGDGTVSLNTLGDLALGRVGATATASYWTDATALNLFSAGGNLVPTIATTDTTGNSYVARNTGYSTTVVGVTLPPTVTAVAASGSIYYGSLSNTVPLAYRLLPAEDGGLILLARDSIYGAAFKYSASLYQPARWEMLSDNDLTLHDGDTDPIRIYAVDGDLVNIALGESYTYTLTYRGTSYTAYAAAKAARVIAGGDIVNFGRVGAAGSTVTATFTPSLILNTNADDVSVIQAGGNIYYLNVDVAGPGTLEVSAGGTIYQGDLGSIASIGPLATGDTRSGASILVAAGLGEEGADWTALYKYLDPANLAVTGTPLADQPGKVAATYEDELEAWLLSYLGYTAADDADALATFRALPLEQQKIFLTQVYFAELKAGGREYNDSTSSRYGSYLRGRQMIAALFPEERTYSGNLVMYGDSGIRTLYGGDISILTPGGQQVIGVEAATPGSDAGLITQGSGDIGLYSEGSILLGLSRIMTTYGGDIIAWSATGDINAGRGSKTTIVYTPAKRVYDAYGNVTLSPVAPSTGAGIATLASVEGVEPGDVDLIAPLGTVDAGEAGIRVSGDVNIAALQIVNAANIQVQGTSMGLPVAAASPNVGAMTAASNTAGSAANAAEEASRSSRQTGPRISNLPSIITVEVIGYGGAGSDEGAQQQRQEQERQRRLLEQHSYNRNSVIQLVGNGALSDAQKQALTPEERRALGVGG